MHYEFKNKAKTSLWEANGHHYETTQKSSFIDRSVDQARIVVKAEYHPTTLWENPEKIEKQISTQKRDYNMVDLEFELKEMSDVVAGVLTKSKGRGFCYGSEEYHKITDAFTVENKRMISIFDEHGKGKFRDEYAPRYPQDKEQSLIRKRIEANITVPIAKTDHRVYTA